MTTHTQLEAVSILGALKRVLGVGTLFMTEYRAVGRPGRTRLCPKPDILFPSGRRRPRIQEFTATAFVVPPKVFQIGVGFQQSPGAGIFAEAGFCATACKANERVDRVGR